MRTRCLANDVSVSLTRKMLVHTVKLIPFQDYAAAFFLLADHLEDAVDVCLRQLKDLQLAIAIARVYEGDGGPVLRKIIQDEILRVAAEEGDRWLASWAFWMLGRKDMAVRALIVSHGIPDFFNI